MINFVFEDFSVTTAEDEQNYFTGQQELPIHTNPSVMVPPGTYRIIDGELYRINQGSPLPVLDLNNASIASI